MRQLTALIEDLKLDLKNLTVLTECANGYYALTPIIALMAGAKVIAVGRNSKYGTFEENSSNITRMIKKLNIQSEIIFVKDKIPEDLLSEVDIVMNSGFVRPIDSRIIKYLKKTAVISLLWETWEFRADDIDYNTALACQIPIIGTNENFKPIDMYKYPGMIALKMMFDNQVDYASDNIALLGGGLTGHLIARDLHSLGVDFIWFKEDQHDVFSSIKSFCYSQLDLEHLQNIDIIFIAEHKYSNELLGNNSNVSFREIYSKNPNLKVLHLCGKIDIEDLKTSNLYYFPNEIANFGHMSVLPIMFGQMPVVKLNIAGLKVGEIAVKARLKGASIGEAIQETVRFGIGQDFPNGFLNFKV